MKNKNQFMPFGIQIILEGKSHRVNITHPSFKGRIRKRIGNGNPDKHESLKMHLKVELEKHFQDDVISKDSVSVFVEHYIDMYYKKTASIFDYFDEFLLKKERTYNKKTKKHLTRASLLTFIRTKEYFKKYLVKKGIKPYPANINKEVLDGYFHYLNKSYNYNVKLHSKLKEFIGFISKEKGFPIHSSYQRSIYNEEYDNQNPKEHDIALSTEQMKKLLDFRRLLYSGKFCLKPYKKYKCIPDELQEMQRQTKIKNLKLSLDCFLFMCSTGMYHADITKSSISINKSKGGVKHFSYHRAKNNSRCTGIPITDFGVFIAKTLFDQYSIQHGGNFPYTLALYSLDRHLREISEYAGLNVRLRSKWGRKTFATMLYFDHDLDIKQVQTVLGHKYEKDTRKYLRVEEDDMADKIFQTITSKE